MEDKFDVIFNFVKKSFSEIVEEVTSEPIEETEYFTLDSANMLSYSIIIGISGHTNGRILLNTSVEYGNNLAKAMNFGDELESQEELFVYLAEFANMFCGRTATYINNHFGQREIWITPPSIFSAKDLDVITVNVVSKKAYYQCSFGKFIVDIGFTEGCSDEF